MSVSVVVLEAPPSQFDKPDSVAKTASTWQYTFVPSSRACWRRWQQTTMNNQTHLSETRQNVRATTSFRHEMHCVPMDSCYIVATSSMR
ncbi:hypothetical protein BAUCODRAFT_123713 [Baudoinia panamericana UAMH 10762]|uniref:Uncharacterized protein n=1 Tax=Baudoinia panamericana (strain UAMH 10762) TaxID=717646 RepID=M2N8T7_BAUPA|nr:uncharacterized protein BAUCODRAFT_123713 [Baudoinia panamericana UAMH 10762]EMC95250.1 hypothetical protein BAUCODRAFT_123713 [Baudoinia panamericana UAMH 10762]